MDREPTYTDVAAVRARLDELSRETYAAIAAARAAGTSERDALLANMKERGRLQALLPPGDDAVWLRRELGRNRSAGPVDTLDE